MAKNEFLFDLKTPETTWRGSGKHFFPNGKEASEAGMITSAEGPHGLYWCLDTIMHKVPEEYMDTWDMPHFHVRGYETFFVDSGRCISTSTASASFARRGISSISRPVRPMA